ncbi:uncharacterized protein E5676_scaffold303G00170 [Cucumis melo var. makuwa]|uniref:Uncharacterized protein n=1 Tax=Cucumis melo var. makuwa TaxID=1194695 RepID=A0A5A7TWF9_CUCMM|nr:uncharacterized protein E6C27_scaffold243G00830 [Cucumis melo var. makuwa]TYK28815.1 uncharacterized protein E5676_scaffold303G00170 [Cucumis melo var. makuwa]
MGGGEHGHGEAHGDFRAKVWSMSGGPYCRPKHWRRNTAIAMAGIVLICIPIAMKSAELEGGCGHCFFICTARFGWFESRWKRTLSLVPMFFKEDFLVDPSFVFCGALVFCLPSIALGEVFDGLGHIFLKGGKKMGFLWNLHCEKAYDKVD